MKQNPLKILVGQKELYLNNGPIIMGILNVTPDSFSDGGKCFTLEDACNKAIQLESEGAQIIDIGGESTRPGADLVSPEEEIKRVIPVIFKIRKKSNIPISIDTTKSQVARAAIVAGADMVNDISGLRFDSNLAKTVAEFNVSLCIMHSVKQPKNMQENINYKNLISDIIDFLNCSAKEAEDYGVKPEKIFIDPGIGFGKTVAHNIEIMRNLDKIKKNTKKKLLLGTSRKSFIGKILINKVGEDKPDSRSRILGTMATNCYAALQNADILRVHDVFDSVCILEVFNTLNKK